MNKLAVVTGGSRGIGFEIARSLVLEGYDILLIARNADRLQAAAAALSVEYGPKIYPLAVDLTDFHATQTAFSTDIIQDRPVDVLVNSAGVFMYGTSELTTDQITELFKINFIAMHHVCTLLRKRLIEAKISYVFNISSIAGLQSFPFIGGYSASKCAIAGYSNSLAEELRKHNTFVTTLFPDIVDTDMSLSSTLDRALMIPAGDIAKTIKFIMSLSNNTYINNISLGCTSISPNAIAR